MSMALSKQAELLRKSVRPNTVKGYSKLDLPLIWVVLTLVLTGFLIIYSASLTLVADMVNQGRLPDNNNWLNGYFMWRQIMFGVLGCGLGALAFKLPITTWQKLSGVGFTFGVVLLALVLIPGLGLELNGARRWLHFLGFSFQPVEFVKLALLCYTANFVTRKKAYLTSFIKGFMPMALAVTLVGVLLMLQPDFGSLLVIVAIAFLILFLSGMSWVVVTGLMVVIALVFGAIMLFTDFRLERIFAFMDPWNQKHMLNKAYQLVGSIGAYARGGFWGVGLGNGVEKQFLPESYGDFILAVVGEELGLCGFLLVVVLLFWLVVRAFAIGNRAKKRQHDFAYLLSYGIGIWVGVQTFINVGVTLGVLPTKGLTLPFLSYGGTSLLFNIIAVALLLRVEYENRSALVRSGAKKKEAVSKARPQREQKPLRTTRPQMR